MASSNSFDQTTDRSDRLDRCPEVESPNCAPVPRYWFISLLFRDPYFFGVCLITALALGDGSSLSRWTASILSINDDEDQEAEIEGDSGFIDGLAKVRLLPNRELTLEYLCLSGVGVVSTWLQLLTESTEEASSSDSLGLPADFFPLRSGHLNMTLRCLAALCMEFSLLRPGPRVPSSALLPKLENEVVLVLVLVLSLMPDASMPAWRKISASEILKEVPGLPTMWCIFS